VADISIVNTGENSPEQVAYQLMKDIQASGVVFKLNADQFLDLYAECLRAVRTPDSGTKLIKRCRPAQDLRCSLGSAAIGTSQPEHFKSQSLNTLFTLKVGHPPRLQGCLCQASSAPRAVSSSSWKMVAGRA
jgi:hypothetical protein